MKQNNYWSFVTKDLCEALLRSVFKTSDNLSALRQMDLYPRMRLWVRLTFGQTSGQFDIWSDVPSRMRLQVRLIFGQTSGWSDVPLQMRHQVRLTSGQTSGQVDIWSDVPPG